MKLVVNNKDSMDVEELNQALETDSNSNLLEHDTDSNSNPTTSKAINKKKESKKRPQNDEYPDLENLCARGTMQNQRKHFFKSGTLLHSKNAWESRSTPESNYQPRSRCGRGL